MTPGAILREISHRPWPLSREPWAIRQTWEDLLFAHWPVRAETVRPLLPRGLELDTFEGEAWVSVVPFRMTGVRVRGLPPIPTAARFPELNVRTYVTLGGKPGVYFISLDAGSPLAVAVARASFFLPYYTARFDISREGAAIRYACRRAHTGAKLIELRTVYGPTGTSYAARAGTLEDWLTARYCLYSASPRGRLYRGEIHHAPWPLQPAEAEFSRNTMASGQSIALPDTPPLLQFARRLDILAWRIRAVDVPEGKRAAQLGYR